MSLEFYDVYDRDTLTNRNETRVLEVIEGFFREDDSICRCRDCRLDIAAITLNRIPPRYAVVPEHDDNEDQRPSKSEIQNVVRKALEIVTNSPHHI